MIVVYVCTPSVYNFIRCVYLDDHTPCKSFMLMMIIVVHSHVLHMCTRVCIGM